MFYIYPMFHFIPKSIITHKTHPMFHFIPKSIITHKTHHSTLTIIRCLNTQTISNTSNLKQNQSFTTQYLINSCGLSLESAVSASKLVQFDTPKKPDSVLDLFKSHGFSQNHIATLISRHPPILISDPEKTLKPKLDYFENMGIVGPDLPRLICSCTPMLLRSLKNHIIPTFDFLKGYVKTNANLIYTLKVSNRVVSCNIGKVMVPNIEILKSYGVPEEHIGKLIMLQPRSFMLSVELFKEVADSVKEMGCDPASRKFILAFRSIAIVGKAKWERKKEVLMSFGWTQSNFDSAFMVQPMFMLHSEKKIRCMMDFFVNTAGLKASDVAKCPNLILASLERRIVPRLSVLKFLMSKGLVDEDLDLVWEFNKTKKAFEARFVIKYMDDVPEVIKAYQIKIGD